SVWLNFEGVVKKKSQDESLVSYDFMSSLATECGIFENDEILGAVRFLNDLGSIQYFERNGLKDKVVIDPQWIIKVISCIVSVKNTAIEDGKLVHANISKIWDKYDQSLHDWILKLTEEFDLTFSVSDKKMHIIPCLLPEKKPDFEWADLSQMDSHSLSTSLKEYIVVYNFEYLPAGLFNRIQVRLYQYGDNSIIWKHGSLLRKNNQKAIIENSDIATIQIKVQGNKPENIVFVIHEVIESLINESFVGIKYDYSFPCPDCVDSQKIDPCLFSLSLLHRANEFNAPFLQCSKYFHAVSIQEMMAVMPIDGISNLDMNLEYSLRDLKRIKSKLKYDISFWYCENDTRNPVNPMTIVEKIEKEEYKIWYSHNPSTEKLDTITYALKESRLVILGISDEFAKDQKCLEVLSLVKNLLKKNYLLIEFGIAGARKWIQNPAFAPFCSDYRVIMQDPTRLAVKLSEMFDSIDLQLEDTKNDRELVKKPPEVFISYCWANSHDAAKKGSRTTPTSLGWLDPRSLVKFFEDNGISCWIDTQEISNTGGIFGAMTRGMNTAKVVVACVSDEYANSVTCKLEFRFAHVSLKIPILKAVVGTGNMWRRNEIAFLGGDYPEVNFQLENKKGLDELLGHVRKYVGSDNGQEELNEKVKEVDSTNSAFQELYELTQRKFLKQISKIVYQMPSNYLNYPLLFCIDFIDPTKLINVSEDIKKENKMIYRWSQDDQEIELCTCIRPLCEHEEGWHLSDWVAIVPELLPQYCGYLLRVMNIIKNGPLSNEMQIFQLDLGHKLLADIEKKSSLATNINESYVSLRKFYAEQFDGNRAFSLSADVGDDLTKCELKSGKVLWLCGDHLASTNAKVIDHTLRNETFKNDPSIFQMLDEIKNVDLSAI
ncbi:putative serine threonine- kinase pats1, partial [Brachionus plicatilis]